MRAREWYGCTFCLEMIKVVSDNYMYARLILFVKRRDSLDGDERLGARWRS